MNENTAKLLEQLASKMGTTSKYLWRILIKQTPIDATINLVQSILAIAGAFVLYSIHMKFLDKSNAGSSIYEIFQAAAVIPMVLLSTVSLISIIGVFASMGDIVNGYFNREYWALNKILEKIKS
jgi:hypothetical protein